MVISLMCLLIVGCRTNSPEKNAYNTFTIVTSLANATIGGYIDYKKTHIVDPELDKTIKDVVRNYLNSLDQAQKVINSYKDGSMESDKVANAIKLATEAANAVLNIIKPIIGEQ